MALFPGISQLLKKLLITIDMRMDKGIHRIAITSRVLDINPMTDINPTNDRERIYAKITMVQSRLCIKLRATSERVKNHFIKRSYNRSLGMNFFLYSELHNPCIPTVRALGGRFSIFERLSMVPAFSIFSGTSKFIVYIGSFK